MFIKGGKTETNAMSALMLTSLAIQSLSANGSFGTSGFEWLCFTSKWTHHLYKSHRGAGCKFVWFGSKYQNDKCEGERCRFKIHQQHQDQKAQMFKRFRFYKRWVELDCSHLNRSFMLAGCSCFEELVSNEQMFCKLKHKKKISSIDSGCLCKAVHL